MCQAFSKYRLKDVVIGDNQVIVAAFGCFEFGKHSLVVVEVTVVDCYACFGSEFVQHILGKHPFPGKQV